MLQQGTVSKAAGCRVGSLEEREGAQVLSESLIGSVCQTSDS